MPCAGTARRERDMATCTTDRYDAVTQNAVDVTRP
jgi:hypothetical protein